MRAIRTFSLTQTLCAAGAAVLMGALVAGCASTSTSAAPAKPQVVATTTPDGTTKVINTMCPIGGDDFGGPLHETALTRTWSGSTIGFCCKNCVRKFDAMTPAARDAVLKLAQANKAPGSPD